MHEHTAQDLKLTMAPLLVDKRTAAHLVGISSRSLDRLVSCGKFISPTRVGGRVMFHRQRLEEWIDRGCPPIADKIR
jgi:predicted DNA-binding transcriptional regulator AlpA